MRNLLLLVATVLVMGCAEEPMPRLPAETEKSQPEFSAAMLEEERKAKAKASLLTVQEAVHGFKLFSQDKKYPTNLAQLVEAGILNSLPDLPVGMSFVYVAATGKVDIEVAKVDE
jgi:hypothetical protein